MSIEINLLYSRLKADSEISDENVYKHLIEVHQSSEEKRMRINGINYYDSENTEIKERKNKELYTNHKIANGFYKKIVDQKVSYCVGNPIVIEELENKNLDIPDINDFIDDLATRASMKGLEWLYLHLDKSGDVAYKIINSEECIPVYDTEYEDELTLMIRYYKIDVIENGESFRRNRVEVYDNQKVTYYVEDKNRNYLLDNTILTNPMLYNTDSIIELGDETEIENYGWDAVPFIALRNNEKDCYDLQNIKRHIDMYDIIESDFGNNIEQFQDAILVVVNRGAQDWDEFWEQLKNKKVITIDDVSDVGGATYLKIDIPVEARKEFLQILRDNIFEFGMAVDTKKIGDGNITNIVIKSRYADLDLKANKFIKQITKFIKDYYSFINYMISEKINIKKLKPVFDKNMIFNEKELIEEFVDQGGRISNKTLLANHPHVEDVEKEEEQIEIEAAQYNDPLDNKNNNGGEEN